MNIAHHHRGFARLGLLACMAAVVLLGQGWSAHAEQEEADKKEKRHEGWPILIEKANSETDKLEVRMTYVRSQNDALYAYVFVRWGDLDKKIDGIGPEYYANWDGYIEISNGNAIVKAKPGFDIVRKRKSEADNVEPGEGSGADALENLTGSKVAWQAGVVGASDGLLFRVKFHSEDATATVVAGNFTVVLNPTFRPPSIDE